MCSCFLWIAEFDPEFFLKLMLYIKDPLSIDERLLGWFCAGIVWVVIMF